MQTYRAFLFNRAGHIEAVHEFQAEGDGAAAKIADAWGQGRRMELWQLDRKLKSWE